jgi:hypothetical protein
MEGTQSLTTEPAYTATIKAGTEFDAPWLVVRADDAAQLELNLQIVESNTTFATLGRLAAKFGAQFRLGKGLGAASIDAPQSAPLGAMPQYSGGTMAAAPAVAYTPAPPAAAAAPAGVPLVTGIPAKWIDKGSWKAWADPRPQHETGPEKLKTDDENHPGLAGGTHKFWRFVR